MPPSVEWFLKLTRMTTYEDTKRRKEKTEINPLVGQHNDPLHRGVSAGKLEQGMEVTEVVVNHIGTVRRAIGW